MAYSYTDRQLLTWNEAPRSAALWERARHLEARANYWKHRCEALEQRVQNHDCQEAK